MVINEKNFINWLWFLIRVFPVEEEEREQIRKYLRRRDVVRRRKELEDIFGGENW